MKLSCLFLAIVLAAVICFPAAAVRAEGRSAADVALEPNTEYRTDLYPYVVRSASADLYIAKADIEQFGLETLCEGLSETLENLELDFADARAALAPYLKDEVPSIKICTDFCNHAERHETDHAYYNQTGNFIKVFMNWQAARFLLLHEYVHYLTMTCAVTPVQFAFWSEGVAEYISRFVCRNRLARSAKLAVSEEQLALLRQGGLLDPEDDLLNVRKYYLLFAESFHRGYAVGTSYNATSNKIIERTEAIQQNPKSDQISYFEAGSMTAWLCETYGEDYVLSHWNTDPDRMADLFGQGFPELYKEWTVWNTQQCDREGIKYE